MNPVTLAFMVFSILREVPVKDRISNRVPCWPTSAPLEVTGICLQCVPGKGCSAAQAAHPSLLACAKPQHEAAKLYWACACVWCAGK